MSEETPQFVRGISKADWQAFRHNPVAKVFFQFLKDKRAFLERLALDMWLDGGLSLQSDQTIRGQLIELIELENMPFNAFVSFYQEEELHSEAIAAEDATRGIR